MPHPRKSPGRILRFGWKEDRDYRPPAIPEASFNRTGRYADALAAVDRLLATSAMEKAHQQHWDRAVASGSTLPAATFAQARDRFIAEIPWLLVLEAENARIWNDGPSDYRSVLREYERSAQRDAKRIKGAVEELKRFDKKHAYLLRYAFHHALGNFMAEENVRRIKKPDQNATKGCRIAEVSGPRVREHEYSYLSRLAFFNFDSLLGQWDKEIDRFFERSPLNWKEFGSLRFDEIVSPREASKFRVAHLGLTAHLVSRLRDFTAGYGIIIYTTGQPIPDHGKPCWDVVAEFVNAALAPGEPQDGNTIRRGWQSFVAKHSVTLQRWPNPAVAESQTG